MGSSDEFLGKKVFFVQPNSVIQKEMVAELIRQEFEVLLVTDVSHAKGLFARFPDCLAFLNIDDGLSEHEWEEFVRDIQSDPALAGVKLGILTYNADPALARKYLMDHSVPCGYVKLSLGLSESTAIVLKVLEANEAKGRRRYLRVPCRDNAKLNWKSNESVLEGRILDISSVGMSCVFQSQHEIAAHSVLTSLQLQLKGSLCLVNGIVMGSRLLEDGSARAYVVLFDPKMPPVQREKIRAYIQWALQASVEEEIRA